METFSDSLQQATRMLTLWIVGNIEVEQGDVGVVGVEDHSLEVVCVSSGHIPPSILLVSFIHFLRSVHFSCFSRNLVLKEVKDPSISCIYIHIKKYIYIYKESV